jgi:hypothetical protein
MISTFGIPDRIKIDVEGAEDKVVTSLTTKVPVLCFEWAAEWYLAFVKSIDHLSSIGFTEFHIQDGDEYDYIPPHYEYNDSQIKTIMATKQHKEDWGMIWAR